MSFIQQARTTYRQLYEAADTLSQLTPRHSTQTSGLRVFQILRNQHDRSLLLSWPTDAHLQQYHPGAPSTQELARTALQVQITSPGGDSSSGSQAKTSCTRRFKSSQTLVTQMSSAEGNGAKHVQIESVYIPHGKSRSRFNRTNIPPARTSGSCKPAF